MTDERDEVGGGPFTKLFASIITSSVWRIEADHVRLVWVTMLASCDRYGVIRSSIPGLADMARVSREDCLDALDRLMSPDPWSRTKEYDGRRIEEVHGGWRLLNHEYYRDLPGSLLTGPSMTPDAVRQRRHRAKRDNDRDSVTASDEGVTSSASASASASGDESVNGEQTKDSLHPRSEKIDETINRPGVVKLRDFMAANDFGRFVDIVEGFIRASRSALAVISTLEMHLTGELSHEKATALQLGLALQQYAATGEPVFKPIFFAGFVRKAKAMPDRAERRRANAAEDRHLIEERRAAETRQQEERDRNMLAAFSIKWPERYADLRREAETEIDRMGKMTDQMRDVLVHDKLVELVRREANG